MDSHNPVPLAQRVCTLRSEVAGLVSESLGKAFPGLKEEPLVAATAQPKFGDYQCNNAMSLFGKLKGQEGAPKNPRAVAEMIVAGIATGGMIESVSIAGPGFVNLKLSRPWLAHRVHQMLVDGIQTWAPQQAPQKVVVDFSSPNVAKEMHVGHLRSTIIGDTICRVLEFIGHDVVRLNHVGDWGTQFGMLIEHMSELRPEGLGEEGGREEDVSDLMALYRAAKQRFDEDEDFKTRSREAVTRLQGGGQAEIAAWKRICEASRREFQRVYDRLGVKLQERGESFYNPMLKPMLEELKEKGVVEESDGAQVIWCEGIDIPLIMQKSDGGFGYASTDMAAIKHRIEVEKSKWVVYVTDVGQAQHFQLVFASARRAGILPADAVVQHVGFGLVLGEDGKRFRTRSGDLVRLVELLDEAYQRCKEQLNERRGDDFTEEEIEHAAQVMGYGAVKYADLKNSRLTNYKFSFDSMLDLKGNTAVYLLYAHARICSIIRKTGIQDMRQYIRDNAIKIEHEKELTLALHLSRFPEAIEDMMDDWMPNRITDFLYETSVRFNEFYTECQVIGSENEASRILLCEATAVTMRACLSLLGIAPLYRI